MDDADLSYMYNLARMTLGDMARASASLRRLGVDATSMESVAQRCAESLFRDLGDEAGASPGCALVRVYTTQRLGQLPSNLRRGAAELLPRAEDAEGVRCLVLLGTAGLEPQWMSRHRSRGHRAIPLPSVEAVERLPMVAKLLTDLGVDPLRLVGGVPSPSAEAVGRTFEVFHVPEARGAVSIPAQDFVEQYAVRSVLGCGGWLPDGELFALILFARVHIGAETLAVFQPLTLAVKLALMPFAGGTVFAPEGAA